MPVKKDILSLIKTKDYEGLECELRNLKTNQKFLNETLKWACFQGDKESVGILVKFGANPNYADEFGTTVLHFAVKGKNQDVIIALVNFGSNYNEWECEGINLEQWCVRNGMVKVLNFLFTKFDCDLTKSDEIGRNYLHLACMSGQVKVVQYILATGLISVDERDENGWTPLHYACSEASSNFKDIIEVLFKYNADPLLLTANNKTSLDLAYESGHAQSLIDVLTIYKMLQLLISADSVIVGKIFANSSQTSVMENIERKMTAKTKDSHLSSKLQDRHITLKLSIWRKVILNDDIELLEEYRDSGIWYNSDNPASFEESQQLTPYNLSEIFQDCFENGVGMFSYFNETFGKHINRCGFADILTNVSGVSQFCSLKTENYTLIGSFQESIVFLSFITGRFKLVEMLLKMLQFEIIPACLIICLVIRQLKSVKKFPQQIIDSLNILAYKSEHIAVDVLNRVYFKDNSPEKQVTLQFLHTQLSSYGNKSLVDLADAANCSNFLSLPCCQLILDKQWYGNIRSVRSHLKWVIRFLPISILIYNPYYNKNSVTLNNESLKAKIDNIKIKSITVTQLNKVKNPESQMNRFQVFYAVINAPGTKFFYHSVAHFFFLIILSYILLFDFHVNIDWKEILCYSFVLGYAIEEVHQCVLISLQTTIKEYICDKWNWLDIAAILTTATGLYLRLIAQHYLTNRCVSPYDESMDKFLYISRVALLSSLLLFYLRMLFIASISAILGPKLKMIADMLRKDFLPLLLLFLIFILAFGVLFQGLLYPNGWYHINNASKGLSSKKVSELKIEIIGLLLKRAIYGIFEPDFPIDEIQCENKDYCVHPIGRILFLSLSLITCIVIVYIMLMNLLIALFSNTVARIDQRSIEHWLADRCKLIEEYKEKSISPPPFNIIERCLNIILHIFRLFKSSCCNHTTSCSHTIICKPEAEVNSIVKFIIIQSFALKSNRHLLGSKNSRKISTSNDNSDKNFELQVKILKDQVEKMDSKLDKILTSISCDRESNNLKDNEEQIFPKIGNLKYQEFQVTDESRRNRKISDQSNHSTKDMKIAKST